MTKRVLLAGFLGGLVIFVWLFVAHEFLGLGAVGVKEIPNEQAVVAMIRANVTQAGFYFFPGLRMSSGATKEQMEAAMKKAEGQAYGILIYHPSGATFITPRRLVVQFALNLVQALAAAVLLAWAGGLSSYASRVGFVFLVGVLASLSTNVEYWNWYSFPSNYTCGYMATQAIGYLVGGLVVAGFVKGRG
jgi:hypothetical protein